MRGLDMPLRMGYGRVSRVSRGSRSRDHRFEDAEGGLGGGPMLRSRHDRQRADRTVAKEDGMKDQGRAHMRMGGLQALVLAAVLGAGGVLAAGQPLPPPCDNPLPAGPVLH
jgi:hypothetical protein